MSLSAAPGTAAVRVAATVVLLAGVLSAAAHAGPSVAGTAGASTVTVRITGGHVTDSRDHGRPVVLVAAALGVPAAVFRTAFSGVTPAPAGTEPDPARVQLNKEALLGVLGPYGVTNEALDAASNYYRYNGSAGEMWPHTAAVANAVIANGKVVSIGIVRAGSGYTSTPVVTVPGHPAVKVKATLAFGKSLGSNGSLASLTPAGRG